MSGDGSSSTGGTLSTATSQPDSGSQSAADDTLSSQEPEPSKKEPEQESGLPDSGASTPKSTPDSESKKSDEPTCEDLDTHECVQRAPSGWQGPFRVNHASKLGRLKACDSAIPGVEALYEDWSAKPASCYGCQASVTLPACKEILMVGFRENTTQHLPSNCTPSLKTGETVVSYDTCLSTRGLANKLPSATQYIGFVDQGTVNKDVGCEKPMIQKSVKPPEAKTYWRVCETAQASLRCRDAEKTCIKKRKEAPEPACIVRSEDTECPSSSSFRNKVETVSSFDDSRDCSECRIKLWDPKNESDFRCEPNVYYYDRAHPQCEPDEPSESHSTNDTNDGCKDVRSLDERLNSIKVFPAMPKFSGRCRGSGWEPVGEIKAKASVTICCNF